MPQLPARRKPENGNRLIFLAGSEDRLREIGMVNVVREELGLQRIRGPGSIGLSAFSACHAHSIRRIELDAGHCCQNFHDTAAVGIIYFRSLDKASVTGVAVDHEIVVIASAILKLLVIRIDISADKGKRSRSRK